MRNFRLAASFALLAPMLPALAADVEVRVIASSEVKPGVYGRVEIGSAPPPPVVYFKPVTVIRPPRSVQVQPVYAHVPPEHAKQWSRHCRKYDLCGVPVYFVKSDEYKKPKKEKKEKKD
jgi:hypothetical protein